jgi:membrane-associated phospholipid phosphatase
VGDVFVRAGETAWTLGKTAVKDALYLAAAPLRLNEETLVPTLAVFSLIGVAFALDKPVQRFSQDVRSRTSDDFFNTFSSLGEDTLLREYIYAGVVALGVLAKENWVIEMGLTAFEAELYSSRLVLLLKKVTGRKRPSDSSDPYDFTFWGKDESFPSGHVINVAPMMAVFSAYIGHWAFDILAYSMITIAMAHRINGNGHWLSDTVTSAVIGIAVGKTLVTLHKNPDLRILPWVGESGVGAGLVLKY